MKKAYIVLSSGEVFEGRRFGADTDAIGELVFNTGMVGYIETLTDPGYCGQIVMQTFPLVGNYGVIENDFAGKCSLSGYIVREWCDAPSNFRSEYDLDTFLREQGVPGVCGVDTRALTRIIRERGVMNAMICSEPPEDLWQLRSFAPGGLVGKVSSVQKEVYPAAEGKKRFDVALLDFGDRQGVTDALTALGCEVTSYPCGTPAENILAASPDGVVISNGPGDPKDNAAAIGQISRLMGKKPMLGIGMGHQLMALAQGGNTFKLKYGHRGGNQPVRDCAGTRTYITAQNHGYAVDAESLKAGQMSFKNANDGTCEGLEYPGLKAFSVQFNPVSRGSGSDFKFLFDKFLAFMEVND